MGVECGHYPQCFLHFFDIHFLDEYRGKRGIEDELLLATKFAFFCSNSIVLPLSSYFESTICKTIISSLQKDVPEYNIFFMGNSGSIEEFALSKLLQYDSSSYQYKIYERLPDEYTKNDMLIKKKMTDTTGIIKQDWEKSVNEGSFFTNFVSVEKILPANFRDNCQNIHALLDGKAYIPEHINRLLFGGSPTHSLLGSRISSFINKSYFLSYLDSLKVCSVVTELLVLNSDYVDTDKYELHIPYRYIFNYLHKVGLLAKFSKSTFLSLNSMKNDHVLTANIAKAIEIYYSSMRELGIRSNITYNNYANVGAMGTGIINFGSTTGSTTST